MKSAKKRVREEIASPVSRIFQEEIAKLYNKGYDLVAETPTYESVKSVLCRERRKVLGTLQNPTTCNEIEFPDELLSLPNKESFLIINFMIDQNKKIFVFAGEESKNLLMNDKFFFFLMERLKVVLSNLRKFTQFTLIMEVQHRRQVFFLFCSLFFPIRKK